MGLVLSKPDSQIGRPTKVLSKPSHQVLLRKSKKKKTLILRAFKGRVGYHRSRGIKLAAPPKPGMAQHGGQHAVVRHGTVNGTTHLARISQSMAQRARRARLTVYFDHSPLKQYKKNSHIGVKHSNLCVMLFLLYIFLKKLA